MSMVFNHKLPIPMEVKKQYPLSNSAQLALDERISEIKKVFSGESDKFLLIIGPCSADNETSVLDYINRLRKVQDKVEDKITTGDNTVKEVPEAKNTEIDMPEKKVSADPVLKVNNENKIDVAKDVQPIKSDVQPVVQKEGVPSGTQALANGTENGKQVVKKVVVKKVVQPNNQKVDNSVPNAVKPATTVTKVVTNPNGQSTSPNVAAPVESKPVLPSKTENTTQVVKKVVVKQVPQGTTQNAVKPAVATNVAKPVAGAQPNTKVVVKQVVKPNATAPSSTATVKPATPQVNTQTPVVKTENKD